MTDAGGGGFGTGSATRIRAMRLVGRRPRASAAVAAALALVLGLISWATQLRGLPDIGDPFDVAAFQKLDVPEERNAFFEYREAGVMLAKTRSVMGVGNEPRWATYSGDWAAAHPAWRTLTTAAMPALAIWRAGTEKPDYFEKHPGGLGMKTILPVTQELGALARLAILEGSRLEGIGDMAGAWGWYRAALRSSRHMGHHGFQIERLFGAIIHEQVAPALTRWASDPRVGAPPLREALDQVIAIDRMTVPPSEPVKITYLSILAAIEDPDLIDDVLVQNMFGDQEDWTQGSSLPLPLALRRPVQVARVRAADDLERSLRVTRLMTANWLAEVDKPPGRRAPLFRPDPPIFETARGPLAPLEARQLGSWLDSSIFASRFFRAYQAGQPKIERERPRQARLVVHLAEQLYRREHGGLPPSAEALVGPYLDSLPEGYGRRP